MAMSLRVFAVSLCVASSLACAKEPGDEGTVGETGTGDTEDLPEGEPARGIHITEVEANQGTAILIGRDGEWVGAEGRNAYMIRDRDTLIRLQHTVDEGWVPREIAGVLHLIDADGNELPPRSRTFMVEGPSDPRKINTEFYFSILADEAKPGLSYWVELVEVSDVDVSGLDEGVNVTPEDFALIGYEQTPLEMKVMLVPIEYTYIDPATTVVLDDADLQQIEDDLLQNNPLQSVSFEIHETYTYDNQLTDLGQLLSPMSALRANEGAAPNVYYHALVDVRGPAVNMVAGIAQLTGDDKSSGTSRVAATVWYKPNDAVPTGSTGTIVHEVGHNQGLSHVYCPNASTPAAGPDPNYPHDGGKIGVYGFGIRNFHLYTPNAAHDYMTYCGNAWVSDWTWNKTYQRIRTLTAWDYEGAPATTPGPQVPLLVGTLLPSGNEDWWVMMGPAPAPDELSVEQRIELRGGGELLDELPTSLSLLSDHETVVVTAPLPEDIELDGLDGIRRVDWRGEGREVELDALHLGPRVRAR